jgi:hypothetical protein
MKTITPQLPTVLGSFAAMLVAFLSLMSGTSPTACLMKAAAAFLVFAGIGLIVRFILLDQGAESTHKPVLEPRAGSSARTAGTTGGLDVIVPGTSVADLLGSADGDHE